MLPHLSRFTPAKDLAFSFSWSDSFPSLKLATFTYFVYFNVNTDLWQNTIFGYSKCQKYFVLLHNGRGVKSLSFEKKTKKIVFIILALILQMLTQLLNFTLMWQPTDFMGTTQFAAWLLFVASISHCLRRDCYSYLTGGEREAQKFYLPNITQQVSSRDLAFTSRHETKYTIFLY